MAGKSSRYHPKGKRQCIKSTGPWVMDIMNRLQWEPWRISTWNGQQRNRDYSTQSGRTVLVAKVGDMQSLGEAAPLSEITQAVCSAEEPAACCPVITDTQSPLVEDEWMGVSTEGQYAVGASISNEPISADERRNGPSPLRTVVHSTLAYPDGNPKTVMGAKKPDVSLIPPVALLEESRVFQLGAAKYGPYNWREKTVSTRVYTAAALRHILAYQDGEDIDPESGQSHLSHARACLAIIIDAKYNDKLNDNRPLPGKAGELSRR